MHTVDLKFRIRTNMKTGSLLSGDWGDTVCSLCACRWTQSESFRDLVGEASRRMVEAGGPEQAKRKHMDDTLLRSHTIGLELRTPMHIVTETELRSVMRNGGVMPRHMKSVPALSLPCLPTEKGSIKPNKHMERETVFWWLFGCGCGKGEVFGDGGCWY